MEREYDFGIYRRPGGRFIVRRFDESIPGLWAPLGVWYDREKAEKLAEALTQEAQEGSKRAKRNRNTTAAVDSPSHGSAEGEEDGTHPPQP